jgi:hypothetical protein
MCEASLALTPDQVRALAALIDSRSVEEAAQTAGVTVEQLAAWINSDEAFQNHLESDAEDAFQLAGHQLLYMTTLATRALTEVLQNPTGGDGSLARVQAAHMVLHQARIYRATDGLEGRITELEKSRDAVVKAQAQCVCGAAHRA